MKWSFFWIRLPMVTKCIPSCDELFYPFQLKLSIRLRTMKLIWFKIKNFFWFLRIGPFQSRSDFLFSLHQHLSRHSNGNGNEVDERLFHSEVVQVKGSQHSRLLRSGFEQRHQDRSQDSSVLVQGIAKMISLSVQIPRFQAVPKI